MKIAGQATLQAPVDKVWDALLDPAVLVRTIPGCERLETTGENAYAMTVTAGVASIKGTYTGKCTLSDLQPHRFLVLSAEGSGAPGTVSAEVKVSFRDNQDGTTSLSYDADAVVGGMIGGVGQRMLSSVSKRLAGEFFSSVNDVLTGADTTAATTAAVTGADTDRSEPEAPAAQSTGVFTAPAPTAVAKPPENFVTGLFVGAGLTLIGVIVGSLTARGRR
ncbi:carbon monoxide dehydrogenase subunit G [Saccharomonospora sp.]|uniref:SRPBCC family protein n=1 Tax=Saccharomonospora sp. TaxID=33913 RepID=UPI00260572FD|nr:carbon monoxide dehydrogenase subunit G [Saccharomonospora sp.]